MIYEYQCKKCKNKERVFCNTYDPPSESTCTCGSKSVRLFSANTTIHFKGPGWSAGYDGGVGEVPDEIQHPRNRIYHDLKSKQGSKQNNVNASTIHETDNNLVRKSTKGATRKAWEQ